MSNVHVGECLDGKSLPVWPLRNKEDFQRAHQVVKQLMLRDENSLTELEQDQLEVFVTLIEVYEYIHYPITDEEMAISKELKKR